jgi:hypothetical protein
MKPWKFLPHLPHIPTHVNLPMRSQTLYWSGTDQQDLWKKHMKTPKSYDYLTHMRWNTELAIEYKFNSHGFRDDEFDQRDCHLALGCSFTEGVGLCKDQTWPARLTNLIGNHVWNLGIGGASVDTCFRMLDHYLEVLRPKSVFLLIPPLMRVELHSEDEIRSYLVSDTDIPAFVKKWVSCEDNANVNRYKNILAMKQLCADQNIKLYTQHCNPVFEDDYARDLMHYGKKTHKHFAKNFYKDYINDMQKLY